MGLTFSQVSTEVVQAAVTSVAQSFAGTTANSFLLAHLLAASGSNARLGSVTDTHSNSWVGIGQGSIGGNCSQVFWALNTGGSGALTITGHFPNSDTLAIFIAEYTANPAAPIDDAIGQLSFPLGTSFTTGAIVANYTNETLIFMGRTDNSVTHSPSDGSTLRTTAASDNAILMDRNISTPGLYQGSLTFGSSGGTYTYFAAKGLTSVLPPNPGGDIGPAFDFRLRL